LRRKKKERKKKKNTTLSWVVDTKKDEKFLSKKEGRSFGRKVARFSYSSLTRTIMKQLAVVKGWGGGTKKKKRVSAPDGTGW